MEAFLPISIFCQAGLSLLVVMLLIGWVLGAIGTVNLFSSAPRLYRLTEVFLCLLVLLFSAGFLLICWLHYEIYQSVTLKLGLPFAEMLNRQLAAINDGAEYALPFYRVEKPPRYVLPLWLENEKYYFWFMSYTIMVWVSHQRVPYHRFRAALHILLAAQLSILYFNADPFTNPLPKFFAEISPWFSEHLTDGQRLGFFMRLYPRMIFYYNAQYMWLHPPLLFLSYACITMVFAASVFLLVQRDAEIEKLSYDFAKLGYVLLTTGMLFGYPWALKAWGPNWWWDPKICSSIMMWLIYSAYLHARLYLIKPYMWYFTSMLGIICFLAMVFTFLSSFLFPGEHSFV